MSPPADSIEARLARHRAFWRGDPVDRPLLGAYLGGYEVPDVYRVARDGDQLEPRHLRPQPFLELFTARCEALERLDQDLFRPASPLYSVPWLEAILGCRVYVHSEVCWPERALGRDQPLEALRLELSEAWQVAAEGFVAALVRHLGGRFPVAGLFLRGPLDVVAALLGTDRLFYELNDRPEDVDRLVRRCAEAWITVSRRLQAAIPTWQGGYVDAGRWLYAPGPISYCSEDTTAMVSERLYREHFLPANQLIADAFPYGYVHRHSVSAHNLEALLDLRTGWAVEVTMDPNGPRVAEMLPHFRRIQERGRPLVVFGLNEEAEVALLARSLSPRGLCVFVQADSPDQARHLLAAARPPTERSS
ncbi:MAG: hypothetical protein ABIL09_27390 [Gemmatimonadota bacterium]